MNEAFRYLERVEAFQVQLVQVDLSRLRRQLGPRRSGHGFRRVLNEIVAPGLPGRNLHDAVRTRRGRIIAVLGCQRIQEDIWQNVEDALVIAEDESVKENGPPDS